MSANPQWNSSLYSPKSPVPTSLLGFGYNGGGGSSGSSGGLQPSGGGGSGGSFNNFPTTFHRSNSGSGSFFPSPQSSSSNLFSLNSNNGQGSSSTSPPIGHFHIGTFNANSAFGEDLPVKSTQSTMLGNGNLHQHRDGGSPSNLGSRETGIIEKLLVCFIFRLI